MIAYDANDTILSKATPLKSGRYDFPVDIQRSIAKIAVEYHGSIPVQITDYLRIYTRLREPDAIHYDETELSGKNVFANYATAEAYTESGNMIKVTSWDTLAMRWLDQIIAAEKTQSFDDMSQAGETGTYTLAVRRVSELLADKMDDFVMIDLLPKGLILNHVMLAPSFKANPTHRYEVIENYNNTGQTAVVFRADELELTGVQMDIAYLSVTIDELFTEDRLVNELFVKVGNENFRYSNPVTNDPRLDLDTYSKILPPPL